jgi:hypothetical protein
MKKPHIRSGRKYNRGRYWIQQRDAAFARAGDKCEVSGEPLSFVEHLCRMPSCHLKDHLKVVYRRAVDHLFPERWIRKFVVGADPHVLENLVVLSSRAHAQKTAIEWRIFRGDLVGYKQELNRLGFDLALLDKAMKALCESVKGPKHETK